MNRKVVLTVSVGLVGCMFVHEIEGLILGEAPSEVHLITSAPLVPASSTAVTAPAVDYVQHNAVYDVVHLASVPRESEATMKTDRASSRLFTCGNDV